MKMSHDQSRVQGCLFHFVLMNGLAKEEKYAYSFCNYVSMNIYGLSSTGA